MSARTILVAHLVVKRWGFSMPTESVRLATACFLAARTPRSSDRPGLQNRWPQNSALPTLDNKCEAWRFAGWADSAILLVAGRARFSRHQQAGARCPSGLRERSAKPPFVGSNPTRASNYLSPPEAYEGPLSIAPQNCPLCLAASGRWGTVSLILLISRSNLLSP
jgi:hypothetical protein